MVAFKLYPAGATTNSDSGVTDITKCLPTLRAMAEVSRATLVCCRCCRCRCGPTATWRAHLTATRKRMLLPSSTTPARTRRVHHAPFVSRQLPQASCVYFH